MVWGGGALVDSHAVVWGGGALALGPTGGYGLGSSVGQGRPRLWSGAGVP